MLETVRRARHLAFAQRDVAAVLDLFVEDDGTVFIGSAKAEQAVGRVAVGRVLAPFVLPQVADGWFGSA